MREFHLGLKQPIILGLAALLLGVLVWCILGIAAVGPVEASMAALGLKGGGRIVAVVAAAATTVVVAVLADRKVCWTVRIGEDRIETASLTTRHAIATRRLASVRVSEDGEGGVAFVEIREEGGGRLLIPGSDAKSVLLPLVRVAAPVFAERARETLENEGRVVLAEPHLKRRIFSALLGLGASVATLVALLCVLEIATGWPPMHPKERAGRKVERDLLRFGIGAAIFGVAWWRGRVRMESGLAIVPEGVTHASGDPGQAMTWSSVERIQHDKDGVVFQGRGTNGLELSLRVTREADNFHLLAALVAPRLYGDDAIPQVGTPHETWSELAPPAIA